MKKQDKSAKMAVEYAKKIDEQVKNDFKHSKKRYKFENLR